MEKVPGPGGGPGGGGSGGGPGGSGEGFLEELSGI